MRREINANVAFSGDPAHERGSQNELLGRGTRDLRHETRKVKVQRRKETAFVKGIQINHGSPIPVEIHHPESESSLARPYQLCCQGLDKVSTGFVPVNAELRSLGWVHATQKNIENPSKVPIVIVSLRSEL